MTKYRCGDCGIEVQSNTAYGLHKDECMKTSRFYWELSSEQLEAAESWAGSKAGKKDVILNYVRTGAVKALMGMDGIHYVVTDSPAVKAFFEDLERVEWTSPAVVGTKDLSGIGRV
ncbi:MAG: hypothetical protein V3U49_03015 [Nitrososphaerales archaeon]